MTEMKKYIIEPRDENGKLDVARIGELPVKDYTEDDLFNLYFEYNPQDDACSLSQMKEWYASIGWAYREKNW